MPDSFRVKLKDPENYGASSRPCRRPSGVSQVVDQRKIRHNFFGFLGTLRSSALIVALIQVFAAILLIGNTVRLSAFNRRRETGDHAARRRLQPVHPGSRSCSRA